MTLEVSPNLVILCMIPRDLVALVWQVQVLKFGWGEKCSPDLAASVSVDTWALTGYEGVNKNPAQFWVQVCLGQSTGCPGWVYSEHLGDA